MCKMRRLSSTHLLQCLLLCLTLWTVAMSEICTWSAEKNTYADGGTGSRVTNVAACQAKCETTTGCVAVLFDGDTLRNCEVFTSEPQNIEVDAGSYASKTLYRRNCVPDTTTSAATTATTATVTDTSAATTATTATVTDPTTTSAATTATTATVTGGCTMGEQTNTKVTSQPAQSGSASVENCKRLCTALQQCQAISYGASTCTIHTTAISSTTSSAGYVFAKKTTCQNGTSCCFTNDEQNQKGSHSSDKTLQATEASCKAMCVEITTCTGISFTGGNTCNFFTGTPTTSSETGSSYFKKSCQASASTGTLVLDQGCNSSETIRLSKLLGFCLLCMIIASF